MGLHFFFLPGRWTFETLEGSVGRSAYTTAKAHYQEETTRRTPAMYNVSEEVKKIGFDTRQHFIHLPHKLWKLHRTRRYTEHDETCGKCGQLFLSCPVPLPTIRVWSGRSVVLCQIRYSNPSLTSYKLRGKW